ncbi:MAG: DNA gyrase/topoisomerase IV subunit A [Candidatus Calescibacterium sp.]|jgi:DNA gyrase subunit A
MKQVQVDIEKELRSSYLSYSMSVIIGRAIPDIQDGLKPVQRRIIWTMWEEGITSKSQYKKSAKIVGSCIGKYHPHGDKAVYDALVRMAQDFVMRYPLVDGQGNFGSIDGDEPAAMRYSEARLTPLAEELLKDIQENTVEFVPNYDESLTEPKFLPARFPNILVNGTSGIAVGMSTSIPPHNLKEVCDAVLYLIDNPSAELDDILKIIKGPDFPTGGIVVGDLKEIYSEGKGQLLIYARYKIEKGQKSKSIVFYEIPYQQNKSKIVEKIAKLASEKIIDGVVRVADESDRTGIRIVVEVKPEFEIEPIVAQLYDKAGLKDSFLVNMLVIRGIQPVQANLMTLLESFIQMRKEVVLKRTKFRLEKAQHQLHILEGYLKAISILDDIIEIIRESESEKIAKETMMRRFGFSEIQAQAILDMRLGRLTKLERETITKQYEETRKLAEKLKLILEDENELKKVIKEEVEEIKQKYGDQRRTEIRTEPPIKEEFISEELKVVVTHDFFVNVFAKTEKIRKLPVKSSFFASEDLTVVSNLGKVYRAKISKMKGWSEKGTPVKALVRLSKDEEVIYVGPADEEKFLILLSKKGLAKKFRLKEVYDMTARGDVVFELPDGDELKDAVECSEGDKIFFITEKGMILGVEESDITARISKAIDLSPDDSTLCVLAKSKDDNLIVVATEEFIKAVKASELKIQNKGGMGIILVPVDKAGKVKDAIFINQEDEICITYEKDGKIASKYIKGDKIPVLSRQAMGKSIVEGKIIGLGKVIW